MPAFERIDRISEEVRREIDRIIREDLNDPRIGGTWSVTRCEVTRDLKFCKARVSILEEDRRPGMMKALKSASGFIRHSLGQHVELRALPEISFELDTNIEYADRINRILKKTEEPKHDDE